MRWLVLLMLLAGPASAGTLIDSGGGAALARALTARLGAAVRVARLHVYAGSAWADVAAAGTPSGVRRYEWRDGTLREIALDSTAAPDAGFTIDDHLFALAEVPLDAFAPLARAAVEASKLVRAEPLSVNVRRDLARSRELRVRVVVDGDGGFGYLEADGKGKVLRTWVE